MPNERPQSEEHAAPDLSAVTERPRILTLDVLRGFALMGLFLVHVMELYELYWVDPQPNALRSTIMFLFSGKAYSLFAFLFGVSFYLLCEDNSKPTERLFTGRLYAWRMMLLLGFGYLHSLAYPGDILQQLAVGGLILLPLSRLPRWAMWTTLVLLLGQIFTVFQFLILFSDESYTQPAFWAWGELNSTAYQQQGLMGFLAHTATTGQIAKWILVPETGSHWYIIGLFLLGLQIGRMGIFNKTLPLKGLWWTLGIAVLAATIFRIILIQGAAAFPEYMPRWGYQIVAGRFFNMAMLVAYIMGIMLLLRVPISHRLLAPFAAAGRMSLTLYIGQSMVVVPLLYGFGLGLWDDLNQPQVFALGAFLWTIQLIGASLWFCKFRYGPLEWLWRASTFRNFKLRIQRNCF